MTKTYLQLAREIATLQAAADKQLAAEKNEAVARLNEVIASLEWIVLSYSSQIDERGMTDKINSRRW